MCHLGGFHLTKWLSNSRSVLQSIDEQERAKIVKDLSCDAFPMQRTLGVCWDVDTDCFGFQITEQTCQPTRRKILSTVSSVYDPLGFAAPFILSAKLILQDACHRGLGWDQELPDSDQQRWHQWLLDLPKLVDLVVPRCIKPLQFGELTSVQLHHFADASDAGYGVVSYIRFTNAQGHVSCSLLLSRSRVAPFKKMTIPRMELTAAVVAARMSIKISQELKLQVPQFFWTDSMSVLRYILNETTRFHTFVANRVSEIRDSSKVSQWRYIESNLNPADIASRGTTVDGLLQAEYWTRGPKFLYHTEPEWQIQPECISAINESDPEVKGSANAVIVLTNSHPLDGLLASTSSWLKLRRTTAWILVAMQTLRRWISQRHSFKQHLLTQGKDPTTADHMAYQMMNELKAVAKANIPDNIKSAELPVHVLEKAEYLLIHEEQHHYYADELNKLAIELNHTKPAIKQSSSIYKLDPFIREGLLRVGGRLSRSSLPYSAKHQILIPHKSPLAKLILHDIHSQVGHQGKNSMTAELRKRFWIPKLGTAIRNVTSRCVLCRKHRIKMCSQKMADLPTDRVVPDKPPFSHTGMDYFGPFEVKRGRVTIKRYGVIFTCFTSRAVHLEVAYSLDTNSCILAIRRFLARRGNIESIRSDNGTNLVGAERELRRSIEQWNQSRIGRALHQDGIRWDFNPPAASHFGGVWERIIRIVRKVLYSVLQEQVILMDDEGLHTVFCEVEHIVNSRPITPVSEDPNDLDALTPNNLLLLRADHTLPCGIFDSSDNYTRRRWRQVQYLSLLFWKRWKTEYLHLLQERQRWLMPRRNLTIGDIVLVMDNTRNVWTMAKVLDATKDKDGIVRTVQVKTPNGVFLRPIHKLSLVLEAWPDQA